MKRIFTFLFLAVHAIDGGAQNCSPLDQTFGAAGKAFGYSGSGNAYARNIIVQPDNKIIQVGYTWVPYTYHFTIVRYNSNGSIDASFGQNGKTTTAIGVDDHVSYAEIQSDGKIVVVGYTANANYRFDIVVVRYNNDGSLDNGFGVGGKVIRSLGPNNNYAFGGVIQPDGKIVVVGSRAGNCITDCWGNNFCAPAFAVARFNSDGSIDNTFGQNGLVTTSVGSLNAGEAAAAILQADGKILVAGQSFSDYACDYYGGYYNSSAQCIVRYNSNGTVDSSFGKNGIVSDSVDLATTNGLSLRASGKILVTGANRNGGATTKQYSSDGTVDGSFGQQGKVRISDGWFTSQAALPDGKIVLAGSLYRNGRDNFQVTRLNNDGSPDTSFNGNGRVVFQSGATGSSDVATGIALQGQHLLVGGYSTNYSGQTSSTLLVARLLDSIAGLPVVIKYSGTLTPCPGESVRMVASESGTLQWYNNGTLLNGAIDTVYTANVSGYYSVTVQNSRGCGESLPVTVAFNGLPVVVTPRSSTTICAGDSVVLVSSEAGVIKWLQNGVIINGATDTAYTAKTSGNYWVSVKNARGCGVSPAATVTVNANKPPVNWDLLQKRLSTVSGYYGYQWYLDGNVVVGANASFFQPVQTGLYKVVISDYGCNNTSDEFNLNCNVSGVPKPSILWNGTQLATTPGYLDYQWSLNGNVIAGVHDNFLRPTQMGIYKVTVTGNLSCTSTSDEFNFNCASFGPPKPPITWTNGYFFTTTAGYSHYQWSLNGTAIAGNDSVSYKPSQTGLYKVTVTDNFGCANTSDSFNLVILGVADIVLGEAKLRCYPNPVRTTINVDVSNARSNKLTAELFDVTGRIVQKRLLNQNKNQLPVQTLPPGLYQLVIYNKTEKTVVKIMVIK